MFRTTIRVLILILVFSTCLTAVLGQEGTKTMADQVLIKTSMGEIEIELYPEKAPIGVENFLAYVREGFYTNTVFHRVIRDFMIQCGGFGVDYKEKPGKKAPIVNEAKNGLKNVRGTLAYARTNDINSATSQFFINHVDNAFLDHKNDQEYGYAVFGKVVKGMKVVDAIARAKTQEKEMTYVRGGQAIPSMAKDVPVKPIIIESIEILE